MRTLLQRMALLSLLAVVSGLCEPAKGQPADPIMAFVGEWDLPGTSITISISKNHYVLHSKLGRGDIRVDNADYYEINFREKTIKCHYIIRLYSQNELSVVRAEQTDPPECDLGELRRARGAQLGEPAREPKRQDDAVQTRPPHAIAGKEPSPPAPANAPPEAAKSASIIQDCKDCPEVVPVPGGFFAMGSPDSEPGRRAEEGPVHRVAIKKFDMGRYAVTKRQFMAFMEETGYSQGKTCRIGDTERVGYSYLNPGFPQDEAHPVVCVTWYDAIAYVSWLSQKTGKAYRLPSEAEREYATRAGAATPYSFGAAVSTEAANYQASVTPVSAGEAAKGTMPAASFAPNAFGLYQMHGNVAEWTQDCWNASYETAPGDGTALGLGDCSKRALRGGAYAYSAADIRSAYRESGYAQDRYAHVGFRVTREETQ
jgi:formylglycine-generating enzyme required for sulfatase activity